MNAPLTYTPAYLGLFAALLLALACNAFLDIQYGGFGFEVACWAALHGWTLRTGWRQRGTADESGRQQQKIVLLLGLVLTVLVFLPVWGLPRAGLYLLAVLQAAQNCVTTSRRQLHLGLLVSLVMVIFAAAHHRADWTMLFYLVPYIVAAVFTLVAEQINRRAGSIRQASLHAGGAAGQGLAIAAATALILSLAGLLYLATPQPSWPYLQSQFGQSSFRPSTGDGRPLGGTAAGSNDGDAGQTAAGAGQAADDPQLSPWRGWPTPEQMRLAAARAGMPAWQADAIRHLADWSEALEQVMAPLRQAAADLLEQLAQWLKEHRNAVLGTLFGLILALLLIGLLALLREARAGTWLRSRIDYWYLARLGRHAPGSAGAIQFYRAMERLFLLADTPRPATANTREFLGETLRFHGDLQPLLGEFTRLFEQCRYGPRPPDGTQLARLKALYRALFARLG